MRKTLGIGLLLVLAPAAGVTPATAAAKPPPRCAAKNSVTLLATRDARVYGFRRGSDSVYACRYRTNRRVRLGNAGECQGTFQASKFRLAGRYVGWVETTCNLDGSEEYVRVADLVTGRDRWRAPAAVGDPATSDREITTFVRDFAINARGSAAWIGVYDAGGETLRVDHPADLVQLRKVEAGASAGGALVDEGQEIVPGSLALTRDGLYYRKGANAFFTTLS